MKALADKKILFFGTPEFAVPSLTALVEHGAAVRCVTMPEKPVGRKQLLRAPPVKRAAEQLGLAILQPEKLNEEFRDSVRSWNPDLAVVAAYGKIFRPALLSIPRHGFVNVHPSLLPRHRGASPIPETIRMGDAKAGVTIMQLDEGLDTGPILAARTYPLHGDETTGTLTPVLAEMGAMLLVEILPAYFAGTLTPKPQPTVGVTLTKILRKEVAYLDARSNTADALERSVRAYTPWPGSWFCIDGMRFKLLRAHTEGPSSRPSGTLVALNEKSCGIVASDRQVLAIDSVQPEGGRPLEPAAFLNGYQKLFGKMLDEAPQPLTQPTT